jgi:hypothetical protein
MYLRSRALIITVESCISAPLPGQNEGTLQQLLATFLPAGGASASAGLASAIVRLGGLLVDDAPDTVGAAQRAVASVVAALQAGSSGAGGKESSAASSWAARVADITKEIGGQQSFLQKMAQTSGGIITKEQTACAAKIVRLQAQKFDLLQPGSLPKASGAESSSPALRSLGELKGVISAHMKVRRSAALRRWQAQQPAASPAGPCAAACSQPVSPSRPQGRRAPGVIRPPPSPPGYACGGVARQQGRQLAGVGLQARGGHPGAAGAGPGQPGQDARGAAGGAAGAAAGGAQLPLPLGCPACAAMVDPPRNPARSLLCSPPAAAPRRRGPMRPRRPALPTRPLLRQPAPCCAAGPPTPPAPTAAAQVAERRSQIQQRQRATFEAVGGKKGAAAPAAPGMLPLAHHKDTLAAVNLLGSLVDPAGGAGGSDVSQLVASQVQAAPRPAPRPPPALRARPCCTPP